MFFAPMINYSVEKPAPIPYQKVCQVAVGVKTVNNHYLGNPRKLKEVARAKGLDAVMEESMEGIGYRDLGLGKLLAYLLFEYIPRSLVGEKPRDLYGLYSGGCKPLLSDMPVVFSFLDFDFPGYAFILGHRKNVFLSEDGSCGKHESLLNAYGAVSQKPVYIYAYSPLGFGSPNQRVRLHSELVVRLYEKRPLIILYKDGKLYGVFTQEHISESLSEPGEYQVYVYTYAYRVWKLFFGLRLLACAGSFVVE